MNIVIMYLLLYNYIYVLDNKSYGFISFCLMADGQNGYGLSY